MSQNIHDRARAMANASGMPVTAAYAELARRSGEARKARRRRSMGSMQVTCADLSAVSGVESPRYRAPYADN